MSQGTHRSLWRADYLLPAAAVLFGLALALRFDVVNRAVSILASAVWGS